MSSPAANSVATLDVERLRQDFPALHQEVHGKPLAYLDNAASAQTPVQVIDAIRGFYERDRANVHRGVHELSQRATKSYEQARIKVQRFLNAEAYEEIIYVRGATEGINLVAATWGQANVSAGDEILVSALEHHSNIVPWQMLCERTGAKLRVIPMNEAGELQLDAYADMLSERVKLVAVNHVSNALGTINPVKQMIAQAHAVGAVAMIDGAQATPHMAVDVRDLDADFYVLSGHKVYGPTGIGVLYGKRALLEAMPPYQGGGDMIAYVTFEKTTYNELPYKFEAGTPNIADAIGLGAAVDYAQAVGLDAIAAYEASLLDYATEQVLALGGIRLVGTAKAKASVLSFIIGDVHAHDAGTILDREGVAVRAGHHCAQPVMDFFGVPATTRASFAFYNTREEVDALCRGIEKVKDLFG
ncbi:MAG: cysteine desulfurase/selenocysteine lyase [Planctomycetota bacterium]|jgi:cysteine desulfurase/selenocysteine lyase